MSVVLDAEAAGRFESIKERDQFDVEYWSLEQAKLGKEAALPLQGQVAVITGGRRYHRRSHGGGASRRQGAEVALLDSI